MLTLCAKVQLILYSSTRTAVSRVVNDLVGVAAQA